MGTYSLSIHFCQSADGLREVCDWVVEGMVTRLLAIIHQSILAGLRELDSTRHLLVQDSSKDLNARD